MKVTSSRQIAINISIYITLAAGLLQGFSFFVSSDNFWSFLILSVLILFLISYLFLYFTLNNLIFDKIKKIYKIVEHLRMPENELMKNIENGDMLSQLSAEVQDWADMKNAEIALLKANAKYRKEFLGNVSHELRTPLFNVQGYILTLLDGGLEDENINIRFLKKAEKNTNRLISIVNDLESITKLESGKRKLNFHVFNIVELIEEAIEMEELLAKKKNIKLLFNKINKKIQIYADRQRIFEVLNNLIQNAIKYGNKDGFTEIKLAENQNKIIISIADNGIGIEEKKLPHIFERFYRVDKSRSLQHGGTGLGLAIVKHIIEAHDQKINVSSEYGKGSTFSFSLQK